jgi:hypothetical protein
MALAKAQHAHGQMHDRCAFQQKDKGKMNVYQIQKRLRARFEDMTDEQLSQVEERAIKLLHPVTGQSFCELAAEHLALSVKRNPFDIVRVIRIAPRFPGLAQQLLSNFPDEECLKDIADGWYTPMSARHADDYIHDACEEREIKSDDWLTKQAAAGDAVCVNELIAYAERFAGWVTLGNGVGGRGGINPAEVHLREERIDALASLLALFATPDKGTAEPVDQFRA